MPDAPPKDREVREALIAELSALIETANADFADDYNAALDRGERPDLWDEHEIDVPLSLLRRCLALSTALSGEGEGKITPATLGDG